MLGRPAIVAVDVTGRSLALCGETLFWIALGWRHGAPARISTVLRHIVEIGLKALGLTLIFAIGVGTVIALQIELALDIANILRLVLGGIGATLTREIAPLLVGILMAARSGSSLTAGLGAMQINREVDALQGMGINPVRLLIAPVALAMMITAPALMGFMVALIVAVVTAYLNLSISASPLLVANNILDGIGTADVVVAVFKCTIFGLQIAVVGGALGLSQRGGTQALGTNVTRAVVSSITTILLTNVVITLYAPI